MINDEVIDEIRAVRHRMSAECGHDVGRFFDMMQKYQEEHPDWFADTEEWLQRRKEQAAETLRVAEES